MRMITAVALLAVTTLKEVAHLGLIDALGDAQVRLSMCKHAALAQVAFALNKCPAKFCLLQIGCCAQLIFGVRIPAVCRRALSALEESAHLGLCQLQHNRIIARLASGLLLALGRRGRYCCDACCPASF